MLFRSLCLALFSVSLRDRTRTETATDEGPPEVAVERVEVDLVVSADSVAWRATTQRDERARTVRRFDRVGELRWRDYDPADEATAPSAPHPKAPPLHAVRLPEPPLVPVA